ncbi:MAG: hypothetical protein GC161_13985 [Planctomycetaceae bacterium]|nr:hypothetical protein [Planctomycetaceae bacterium]
MPGGGAYDSTAPTLRLTTALAEGADRIVARAALAAGYGLHVVLPFPKATYERDFVGESLEEFRRLVVHSRVGSCTELDVTDKAQDPLAYRAAGLLTLAHSDVLIALWDGQPAAGVGGTAEMVIEAHRRQMVVVRITPGGEVRLLKATAQAPDPMREEAWLPLELTETAPYVSTELADRVRALLCVPEDEPADSEARHSRRPDPQPVANKWLSDFRAEAVHSHTYFCAYELMRKIFLPARRPSFRVDHRFAHNVATAWKDTRDAAIAIGGHGLWRAIDGGLRERWLRADNLAIHYAHRFRTAYVLNFSLAALAVIVGLLALFSWESTEIKAGLVGFELLLIGAVLWVFRVARNGRWHERWLDYRRLAETLRPARLSALLGSSPLATAAVVVGTEGERWVAWYVRAALRELAPPTAVLNNDAMVRARQVALQEEIAEQIEYHRGNAKSLALLDHRLERTAEMALWLTIIGGLVYLALWCWDEFAGGPGAAKMGKPTATFLGGALPMVGAAIFGIRATADFRSARLQSERMVTELSRLETLLKAQEAKPDRDEVGRLFDQLSRTLSDDVRLWNMVYSGRELVPGF